MTLGGGLTVTGGTITLPTNSISTSAINGISNYLTTATASSTYATTSSLSNYLTTTNASSTYATKGTANTFSGLQTFSGGLTVSAGTITFPSASIPSTCISGLSGGISASSANTFTALQTFNNNIGLPSSTMTAPTVNQKGYTLTSQNLNNASATISTSNGSYNYTTLTLTGTINSVWIVNAQIGLRSLSNGSIPFNYWGVQLGSSFAFGMTTYGMKTMLSISANTAYYDTTSCVVITTAVNQNIVLGQNITISGGGCQVYQYSLSATRIA
jgi:hypothetical protein